MRHQLLEHDGKYDAAYTGSGEHEGKSQSSSFYEIGRNQANGGAPDETHSQATADTLGQEDLPILVADGRHHNGKTLKHHAAQDGGAVVASVEEAARNAGKDVDQENLYRNDPRHGGRGQAVLGHIVGLEQTPRVQVAPGAEETEVPSKNLGSLVAAGGALRHEQQRNLQKEPVPDERLEVHAHTCDQAFSPPSGGGSSRNVEGVTKRCSAFAGREAERCRANDCWVFTVRIGSRPSFSASSEISRVGPGSETGAMFMVKEAIVAVRSGGPLPDLNWRAAGEGRKIVYHKAEWRLEAAAGLGSVWRRGVFLRGAGSRDRWVGTDSVRFQQSESHERKRARHRLGLPMHNRKSASGPGSMPTPCA